MVYIQTNYVIVKPIYRNGVIIMRISAKGRYGIAALASMAKLEGVDKIVTLISLSERLNISKIYLEQVFNLLKRGGIVTAVKGARGGYYLAKQPKDISIYNILSAIETTIFEKTEPTIQKGDDDLERAINENVFDVLDNSIKTTLSNISLEDIVNKSSESYMYYL